MEGMIRIGDLPDGKWAVGSIDFVDVNGRRVCPWFEEVLLSNARSSTALTPPVMDGVERFPAESTIKSRPPNLVDVRASLAKLDDLKAYRDAENVRGEAISSYMQRMVESFSDTWVMHCARTLEAAGIRTDGRTFPEKSDNPERHWTPEVHFLLELAESVDAPDEMPNEFGDVEFEARDGWKVTIFYDCCELDYIDHFTRPDGTVIDFWDWPEGTPGRGLLIAWRGVGDYARLKREVA